MILIKIDQYLDIKEILNISHNEKGNKCTVAKNRNQFGEKTLLRNEKMISSDTKWYRKKKKKTRPNLSLVFLS